MFRKLVHEIFDVVHCQQPVASIDPVDLTSERRAIAIVLEDQLIVVARRNTRKIPSKTGWKWQGFLWVVVDVDVHIQVIDVDVYDDLMPLAHIDGLTRRECRCPVVEDYIECPCVIDRNVEPAITSATDNYRFGVCARIRFNAECELVAV